MAPSEHTIKSASQASRKRKGIDLANLRVCVCGVAVSEDEMGASENVVKCCKNGCETGWVCVHSLPQGVVLTVGVNHAHLCSTI